MDRLVHKSQMQMLRKNRVRARISGTSSRPRLSVFISNRHITAQLIDDVNNTTIVYVSTVGISKVKDKTLTEQAQWVGHELAKQAQTKDIKKAVFDRGSRLYHGRIKALADIVRQAGLEF